MYGEALLGRYVFNIRRRARINYASEFVTPYSNVVYLSSLRGIIIVVMSLLYSYSETLS